MSTAYSTFALGSRTLKYHLLKHSCSTCGCLTRVSNGYPRLVFSKQEKKYGSLPRNIEAVAEAQQAGFSNIRARDINSFNNLTSEYSTYYDSKTNNTHSNENHILPENQSCHDTAHTVLHTSLMTNNLPEPYESQEDDLLKEGKFEGPVDGRLQGIMAERWTTAARLFLSGRLTTIKGEDLNVKNNNQIKTGRSVFKVALKPCVRTFPNGGNNWNSIRTYATLIKPINKECKTKDRLLLTDAFSVSSYSACRQFQTQSSRSLSKDNAQNSRKDDDNPIESNEAFPVMSKKDQLKRAVKDYGSTVIVFHVMISLASLGFFYVLVSSGIDVMSLVVKLPYIGEQLGKSSLAAGASTFVIAYAVHKVFVPVRMSITLTATPFIVRYLRAKGFLKLKSSKS